MNWLKGKISSVILVFDHNTKKCSAFSSTWQPHNTTPFSTHWISWQKLYYVCARVRVFVCVSSEQGSKRNICQWQREESLAGSCSLKLFTKIFIRNSLIQNIWSPPPIFFVSTREEKHRHPLAVFFLLPFSKCSGMPKIGNTSQGQLLGNLGAVLFD